MVHAYGSDLDVVTRFFIRFTGVNPTVAQLDAFNASVGSEWNTALAAEASTFVNLATVESTDLTTPSSAQATTATDYAGSRAGDEVPASAAAVAAYEISRRYRGGHPRGYWPFGVAGDLTTVQHWSNAFVAEFTASLVVFFGFIVGAGWAAAGTLDHVNVSFYHGFTVVTNPSTGRARNVPTLRGAPIIDAVVGIVGRARVGSQRRRLGP
jgi:hypothetical protein